MSLLNINPFLNSELEKLSESDLGELQTLIDGTSPSTFVYRSLVNVNALLSADDKLAYGVNLELSKKKGIVSGWFLGTSFIQFFANRPEMQMYKINLSDYTYEVVDEPFTATDLRQAIDAILGGGGGGSLDYATNAEIDALFEEPVEYATFEVGTLTNCSLSGISDGDQIVVGQPLTFIVTGTESNMVGASISNNGVAYTLQEIGSMVVDQGENWFQFTIPVVNGDIVVSFEFEGEEPETTVYFSGDGIDPSGLNWDGQIIEPGDEIDVSFTANNLVSNSRFIDIEDITPDFLVTVSNDGIEDTGATITESGSGMNHQWRIQTIAQGEVEIYVQYDPVTFNDDVLSGNHGIYTNMTQVDFANLGTSSVASSFSQDDVWDSYNIGLDVNTHAIPLYTPRGFSNQVLQSEIIADPAQHQGFWLYIDPQNHKPIVCCVHGNETSVTSMNDFTSFGASDLQPGQSVDCIDYFNDENFNGDINVARFFFEDLSGEISGAGNCFLFWDKSS